MATFPPEQVWIVGTYTLLGTRYVGIAPLKAIKFQRTEEEVLRVCSNKQEAKKWLRAFNHKGGYESWLKNKTNSQQQQKHSS